MIKRIPLILKDMLLVPCLGEGVREGQGPTNSWNNKRKRVFNKHTIKVFVSYF